MKSPRAFPRCSAASAAECACVHRQGGVEMVRPLWVDAAGRAKSGWVSAYVRCDQPKKEGVCRVWPQYHHITSTDDEGITGLKFWCCDAAGERRVTETRSTCSRN